MHFHNFLWLSSIFLIFSILNKHEQTSWFQTMEFIESTHAKSIRALEGGPDIHDILFNIVCLISSWFLIPLDDIHLWICFIFIVELPLFPMEVLMPANQVRSFCPPTLKFHECVYYHESCPCLMPYLIALMLVWLSPMKHMLWSISILTFMFHDSAWEVVQVRTLTLSYDQTFLFDMLFFLKSPSLPRYPWSTIQLPHFPQLSQ